MATETSTTVQTIFTIEEFDNTKYKWTRWVKRLEGAFTIFNVAENRKVGYILHYMGAEAFDTLCDKLAPEDPWKKDYKFIVEFMQQYYDPAPLEIAENFRFNKRKQLEGEGVQEYLTALQKMAINYQDELPELMTPLIVSLPYEENKKLLFQQCSLRGRDYCNVDLLKELLEEVGPNALNESGETPLGVALKRLPKDMNFQVFDTILKCGGNGMFRYKSNRGVLADVLLYFGSREALKAYLPYHVRKDATLNNREEVALHILAFRKEPMLVKQLLRRGANPNMKDIDGKTPLHVAAMHGSPVTVEHLMKYGAIGDMQCQEGSTALHYACGRVDNGTIDILMKYKCCVNIFDRNYRTPLFTIIKHPYNKEGMLVKLINAGAVINHALCDFKPLHQLATEKIFVHNAWKYAKLLIDKGADVNEVDQFGWTPLHQAARYGSQKFIRCLFENGADVNILDCDGKSCLHIANAYDHTLHKNHIVKYIVLREYQGVVIHENIKDLIAEYADLSLLYAKLVNETHQLSEVKDPVSYMDIYVASKKTIVDYTRDERIVEHMDKLSPSVDSIFAHEVKMKFKKALDRKKAIQFCQDFLCEVFDNRIPYPCAKQIIDYLSTEDIWELKRLMD